jgi:hypothetical protein
MSTLFPNTLFTNIMSISFSVIKIMNRSEFNKKTDSLRKFKGGTYDKSDSNVQNLLKPPMLNRYDGYPYH